MRNLMSEEVTLSYENGIDGHHTYTYTRVQNLVKYTVVDISDRSSPSVEKELYIEGTIILPDWSMEQLGP